jgi:hypothetical protein
MERYFFLIPLVDCGWSCRQLLGRQYFPPMVTHVEKKSQTRMVIAIALFITSILTSFVFALLSNQGSSYWVMRTPVAAGVQITSENVHLTKINLSRSTDGYLPQSNNPIGTITKRSLARGELLNRDALTRSANKLNAESLSLSIRSVDLPLSIQPGALVSIYQLHDVRNGENVKEPRLVISSVFVKSIEGREASFSGEVSVTVTLSRLDIPSLLAATTSGRLVIVATSG